MFCSTAIYAQEVSRQNSPNRFIVKPSLGVFSDFAYDHEEYSLNLDNVMYGGMIGYRSDFRKGNYKFSSNGRDKTRSNVAAIFLETGPMPTPNFLVKTLLLFQLIIPVSYTHLTLPTKA